MAAGFTPWTAVVYSTSTAAQTRAVILAWLNKFQNISPPAGESQKGYGLSPDGEVYQYFYAFTLSLPSRVGATSKVSGMREFGIVFSDTSAAKLNIEAGVAYVADLSFSDLVKQDALNTAIANVELLAGPPGPVVPATEIAGLMAARDDIQGIISAEVAKAVSAVVDPDQIRAQAVQSALDRVNSSQVYSDVSTRIYNALVEDSDDIISSANLSLLRGIVAQFETKLSALQTRITTIESGAG